ETPWQQLRALTGAERRLLKLAVLKKWTPRQVKSPYNTWSLAVRCPVSSHRRQSQQSGMELGLHFRRGFERRIVFVVGAHESRRDVSRLDHARPPSILAPKGGEREFVRRL